jgi:serine protease inhibitor ecotin
MNINRHNENIYHFKTISTLDDGSDKINNKKMDNIRRTPKDLFKSKNISSKYSTMQTSPNEKKTQNFINKNIIYNNTIDKTN